MVIYANALCAAALIVILVDEKRTGEVGEPQLHAVAPLTALLLPLITHHCGAATHALIVKKGTVGGLCQDEATRIADGDAIKVEGMVVGIAINLRIGKEIVVEGVDAEET